MDSTINGKEENDKILAERARELLNEDPTKTEDLITELKTLVKSENGLTVPDERTFYLKFLRAGLHQPMQSFEIIKNFFKLKGKHKYFEVKGYKYKLCFSTLFSCINIQQLFITLDLFL